MKKRIKQRDLLSGGGALLLIDCCALLVVGGLALPVSMVLYFSIIILIILILHCVENTLFGARESVCWHLLVVFESTYLKALFGTLPVIDCLADLLRHGAALLLLHCAALLPVDSAALLLIDGGALLLIHSAALLLSCGPTLLLVNCKRNILMVYLFCSIPIGFKSEVFNQSERLIAILYMHVLTNHRGPHLCCTAVR